MKIPWVLLLVFCLRVSGQGANGNGAVPQPTPTPVPPAYDVRLSFYTWPVRGVMHGGMDIPPLPAVVMRTPAGGVALPLRRNAQTEAFQYVGNEAPVLATPTSVVEDADGTRRYQFAKVAELNVPRHVDQLVVILFPEEQNAEGHWRHILVPASNVQVPDGHLRVINTTDQGLVLEINETFSVIQPRQSFLLAPAATPATSRGTRYRLRLHGKDELDRARLLHTSVYRSNQERGNLIIAYEENGRIRSLKLENHEPPAETPPVE